MDATLCVSTGYSLFSSSTLLASSLSLGLPVIAFLVVATFLVVLLGGAEVVVLAGRLGCGLGCGLGFGFAVVLAVLVVRRVVLVLLGVVLVVLRCVVLLVVELVVLVILGVVEGGARTAVAFLPGRMRRAVSCLLSGGLAQSMSYPAHFLCSTSCSATDRAHRRAPRSRSMWPACAHRRRGNPWHLRCW